MEVATITDAFSRSFSVAARANAWPTMHRIKLVRHIHTSASTPTGRSVSSTAAAAAWGEAVEKSVRPQDGARYPLQMRDYIPTVNFCWLDASKYPSWAVGSVSRLGRRGGARERDIRPYVGSQTTARWKRDGDEMRRDHAEMRLDGRGEGGERERSLFLICVYRSTADRGFGREEKRSM
ncbi:hypothetical protein P153DRAFT_386443 [Dothidotthia symphoricarpi CBS 119687]|uniref:Uncharacterized protein n=1 Tax=Dothidotthia symphoricarpi CBS 119687 TaxID=1392245 RepID=A0A6A6ABT8_9PLEO|nr:uncharacterized protein P153DRAFT_386443 [Dothidotthia symphoricarpi CBS 119687]KAF2128317.1 hypothetical protein P153DRAFT_386443 [Dothidotthia symphoricarpi CBS 119687]